jgi:hypothetical protein
LAIDVWLTACARLASAIDTSPRSTLSTIRVLSSILHFGCLLAMRDSPSVKASIPNLTVSHQS